jgi:hypothetical protein
MEEIRAYKLSDGTLTECYQAAKMMQAELDFKDDLQRFANKHIAYPSERDQFIQAIKDNASELIDVLDIIRPYIKD